MLCILMESGVCAFETTDKLKIILLNGSGVRWEVQIKNNSKSYHICSKVALKWPSFNDAPVFLMVPYFFWSRFYDGPVIMTR